MGLSRGAKVASFATVLAIALGSVVSGAAAAATRPTIVEHSTVGSAHGPVVVAIGDAVMEGHGLDPSDAWPALLAKRYGWRLANLASDGSGFATLGDNGDTFADQIHTVVRLHPSIVIVSGSSNDLGERGTMIAQKTDATLKAIHAALPDAQILAVSPVWNDTPEPAQLKEIGADVAESALDVGARNLDIGRPLAGQRALLQPDDVHPTAAGQQAIASAVEKALSRSLRGTTV